MLWDSDSPRPARRARLRRELWAWADALGIFAIVYACLVIAFAVWGER